MISDTEHIAGTNCENDVSRLCSFAEGLLNLRKGLKKPGARNLSGQISGGDANSILLSCGINLRKICDRRTAKLLNKVLKQRMCAGVGMRLENNDCTGVVQCLHSIEHCAQLARMMGIIIIEIRAIEFTLKLKTAACSLKSGQSIFHRSRTDAQLQCRGGSGKSVAMPIASEVLGALKEKADKAN